MSKTRKITVTRRKDPRLDMLDKLFKSAEIPYSVDETDCCGMHITIGCDCHLVDECVLHLHKNINDPTYPANVTVKMVSIDTLYDETDIDFVDVLVAVNAINCSSEMFTTYFNPDNNSIMCDYVWHMSADKELETSAVLGTVINNAQRVFHLLADNLFVSDECEGCDDDKE